MASIRRAWSRSASTVIVMRETSGFSVRPTVSESMLKARRRNSDATRVSTPGLFSTYTTNVFIIVRSFETRNSKIETGNSKTEVGKSKLEGRKRQHDGPEYRVSNFEFRRSLVLGALHERARPPDHLVQSCPSRHHGIHRILLLYLKVDQHRPVVLARHLDRRHHLRALGDHRAADAISLGQLGELRIQQRGRLVVALVEELLPLADHSQIAVVDDGDVDFQLLLDQG